MVNGEVEAEASKKWTFPRTGLLLTLLAGDHDTGSGKTEDLKGSLSGFAVYQPPSDPMSWGWRFSAMLCACTLLYLLRICNPKSCNFPLFYNQVEWC